MASEIEKRFLLAAMPQLDVTPSPIVQAYLSLDPAKLVRVRQHGQEGFLTIKGLRVEGMNPEFEYPIPLADVFGMMALAGDDKLTKDRYNPAGPDGRKWDVDKFTGRHDGLVLAEVELPAKDTPFAKPAWLVGYDVTNDHRFSNGALIGTSRAALMALISEYTTRAPDIRPMP